MQELSAQTFKKRPNIIQVNFVHSKRVKIGMAQAMFGAKFFEILKSISRIFGPRLRLEE